ncbi:hypothetical protein WG936_08135 [Corynebacterium sp. H127]|uniref:hypothetical protein n=1 Tax=Corynebacterium sp. H127 TaxID=3133418 RepID=UPI0030AEBAA5
MKLTQYQWQFIQSWNEDLAKEIRCMWREIIPVLERVSEQFQHVAAVLAEQRTAKRQTKHAPRQPLRPPRVDTSSIAYTWQKIPVRTTRHQTPRARRTIPRPPP